MVALKLAVAAIGVLGIFLAGTLGHQVVSRAQNSPVVSSVVQFGGVSGQTATSAGTHDTGVAFFTQAADGLKQRLTAGR